MNGRSVTSVYLTNASEAFTGKAALPVF